MATRSRTTRAVQSDPVKTSCDIGRICKDLPPKNDNEFKMRLSMSDSKSADRHKKHLLEVDDKYCGKWSQDWGEGYSHHASFGDNGTTASISRYGDVMQVTQYLGKGSSSIFSMDQADVNEPRQLAARAHDLEDLSTTSSFGSYTFGIVMIPNPVNDIPSVRWLNWKWPRLEWQTKDLRVIFQYMVREGVVLHQLLFQNNSHKPQDLPVVLLASDLKIRDLDYLHFQSESESEFSVNNSSGPHGYGRVTIKPINPEQRQDTAEPEESQATARPEAAQAAATSEGAQEAASSEQYQVVALTDMFIDGTRECMETWEDQKRPLGKLDPGQVKEVVVAYKLSDYPKEQISWENIMIPAKLANVNKFIREELERVDDDCMIASSLLSGSQLVDVVAEAGRRHKDASSQTVTESPERPKQPEKPSPNAAPASLDQSKDDPETAGIDENLAPDLDKIGYLTWRHLEHILSVCAIPIPQTPTNVLEDRQRDAYTYHGEGIDLVALTCGDMSGHRVCTSASFYAFKFLIDVEHRLASDITSSYINGLRDRIRRTREGHVKWLGHVWEDRSDKALNSGCFAANYWVMGEEMPKSEFTWQPDDAITDTAFQILKITSYARALKSDHHASTYPHRPCDKIEWIQALLTKIFVSWLHALDKLDIRAKYAWPHGKEDGVNTFRLEDHFWIWKALESMEDLKMWAQLPSPNTLHANPMPKPQDRTTATERIRIHDFLRRVGQRDSFGKLSCAPNHKNYKWKQLYGNFHTISKRMVPNKVLRGVLQRFTTTNDISGSRMLAVKRSPRDVQFLLDNRDNALVLNQLALDGKPFFAAQSFKELWNQTLNVQPFHLENEEYGSQWYYVTRYLLGIMLGIQGKSLNDKNPDQALQESTTTLLRFFGHNGFLGAHLSDDKEPVLFADERDRDSYYHASFEAIYMLHVLSHANQKQDKTKFQHESGNELSEILHCLKDISANSKFTARAKAQRPGLRQGVALIMKENMPSNWNIDASNICMVEEEEWIHNFPEFLSASTIHLAKVSDDPTETDSNAETSGGANPETSRSVPSETTQNTLRDSINQPPGRYPWTIIAQAKKQKLYGQPRAVNPEPWTEAPCTPCDYEKLQKQIEKPRTAQNVKKRFIWLPQTACNEPAMRLCQNANSSEAEKQAIDLFFSHHVLYENLYHDDTALALNSWQTELNLTFYLRVSATGDTKNKTKGQRLEDQSTEAPRLKRASMGYRFDGDLFDRYWTCHYAESVECTQTDPHHHSKLPSSEDIESVFESYEKSREQFKQWWQRKILELHLTHRILKTHITESNGIITQVAQILKRFERLSQVKLTASGIWELGRDCQGKLQEVAGDLNSTLETLEEWNNREKKRGQERPRWTLNDEKKYRRRIRELQTLIERDQRRLRNGCSDVEKLQKGFENQEKQFIEERERERAKLESERAKEERASAHRDRERAVREAQSDRNIRWFTYVTIVFAPLSFAEGFYSMGGAPAHSLVISLVKFCFAALAITVALILTTIMAMPSLKKWKKKILENEVVEKGVVKKEDLEKDAEKKEVAEKEDAEKEEEKTPWDRVMVLVLRFLVTCLLYPRDVWKAKSSFRMIALAFAMSVILDLILAPIFLAYWPATFLALNSRDFYILLKKKWPRVPSEDQMKAEDPDQGGATRKTGPRGPPEGTDLEAGLRKMQKYRKPTNSSRRCSDTLEHKCNLATCPPRLLSRMLEDLEPRDQGSPENVTGPSHAPENKGSHVDNSGTEAGRS